jgi:protoporphyrinogen oxidase
MFPPGKTGIMVEVTCGKEDALFQKSDKEIYDRVILDLVKTKLISPEDIVDYFVKRIPDIYPVYSLDYKKNLQVVIDYLNGFDNCYTIGRNGLFNYNNADHCIDMSKKVANHILINGSRQQWKELLTYFDEYKIVD